MTKWAEKQPKDGDVVLHCGHLDEKQWHWWKWNGEPMSFRRPDGTEGEAGWIICCPSCLEETKGDPERLQVRGDATWKGNAPFIPAAN